MPIRVTVDNWEDIIADTAPGIVLAAQGLIAQNFDRQVAQSSTIMVAQRAYYMLVPLRAGQVIENIVIAVTVAGATMSLSKCAIYDLDGNRLAVSADQDDAWESTGIKEVPLTDPYVVPESGGYYFGVLANGGTLPTLLRGMQTSSLAMAAVGSGAIPSGTESTQTDFDATATIAAQSGLIDYWIGAS